MSYNREEVDPPYDSLMGFSGCYGRKFVLSSKFKTIQTLIPMHALTMEGVIKEAIVIICAWQNLPVVLHDPHDYTIDTSYENRLELDICPE